MAATDTPSKSSNTAKISPEAGSNDIPEDIKSISARPMATIEDDDERLLARIGYKQVERIKPQELTFHNSF